MIRIVIADDHQMFLDGIKAFLSGVPEIEIVGEGQNGLEVLEILKKETVDVAVLDVNMPKMDGIETTRQIKANYPNIKVLIVTMFNEKNFILNLMQAGANGYILKNKSKEELVGAIHNVFKGNSHFSLDVLNTVSNTSVSTQKEEVVELTDREKEVLCEIAEGLTTKQIAKKLFISEPTVNTHRRNLLSKIGVSNEKFLVRYAIKHGFIEL